MRWNLNARVSYSPICSPPSSRAFHRTWHSCITHPQRWAVRDGFDNLFIPPLHSRPIDMSSHRPTPTLHMLRILIYTTWVMCRSYLQREFLKTGFLIGWYALFCCVSTDFPCPAHLVHITVKITQYILPPIRSSTITLPHSWTLKTFHRLQPTRQLLPRFP